MNRREVWDASGSSNLIQLHAHTSSHIFRKTKDECMSDELHPKRREYLEVSFASRGIIYFSSRILILTNLIDSAISKGPCLITPRNQVQTGTKGIGNRVQCNADVKR